MCILARKRCTVLMEEIRLNQLIGSQSHQCTGTGVQDFFHQQSQWKSGFTRVFLGGGFNFFYVHGQDTHFD